MHFSLLVRRHRLKNIAGFTLFEIMLVCTILVIVQSLAVMGYRSHMDRMKADQVVTDLRFIQGSIDNFRARTGDFPDSLADIDISLTDPWGNPYAYVNFANLNGNGNGGKRKDKNLVPLNSDYDLYSSGADGESRGPLTARASRDDIIRANNGMFVGAASSF